MSKNVGKNLSNKYNRKLPNSTKKSMTDAIKNASKRATQNTAEPTDELIGNKNACKITNLSRKSSQINLDEAKNEKEIPKERYLSLQERQQFIGELRLV